jgi:L-malate glycosyltransferase
MRILHLRPHINSYGVSKILFQLAVELQTMGHTTIAASENRDSFKEQFEKAGIRHYYIPLSSKTPFKALISFISLIWIIKKEKISLIHSHHRWSTFLSLPISKLLRIPLITTCHSLHEGKSFLSVWGDHIISVSNHVKNNLVNDFHVDNKMITVIPNGINIPELGAPPANPPFPFLEKSTTIKIAHVARLSIEKNQECLLHALKLLVTQHPDVLLVIFGAGNCETKLKNLTQQLGLSAHVVFAGQVDNIPEIFPFIDFLVLTSFTEGMPLCVLEALSFEKPVVSTDVGDIPSLVVEDVSGKLAPSNNPQAFASAMAFMIEHKEEAIKMGKNGRKIIIDNFSVAHMAKETEKVYNEIVKKKKKRNEYCFVSPFFLS